MNARALIQATGQSEGAVNLPALRELHDAIPAAIAEALAALRRAEAIILETPVPVTREALAEIGGVIAETSEADREALARVDAFVSELEKQLDAKPKAEAFEEMAASPSFSGAV